MATHTRVPGAASSEVDFELERFERTSDERIEIAGRWYGLRGRRFVRPVLNLHVAGGTRRRAIALLEHKPWAADDGQTWLAAFAWPEGTGEVESAELEVGPGLVVDLPAPGGEPGTQGRVSALRPHPPASVPLQVAPPKDEPGARRRGAEGASGGAESAHGLETGSGGAERAREAAAQPRPVWERRPSPPRDMLTAAIAERDEAAAARDDAERDRVQALNDRDDALSRRDAALRDVERAQAERDEAFAERDRLRTDLERVTRERDVAHAERNRTMRDTEAVARERDQAAAERDAARSELSRALPGREEALRKAEAEAARADQAERERDTAFAERKSAVAQRDRARRERDRAMRAAGVEPPSESPHVAPSPLRHRQPSAATAAAPGEGAAEAAGSGQGAADAAAPGEGAARGAGAAAHQGAATGRGEAAAPVEGAAVRRAGATPSGEGAARGAGAAAPGEGAARGAGAAASGKGTARGTGAAAPDGGAARGAGSAARDEGTARGTGAAAPHEGAAGGAGAETPVPPGSPLPSRPVKRIGGSSTGPLEPKPLLTPVDSGLPRRLSRTRRPPSAPARWAVRIVALALLIAVAAVFVILLASIL